MFDFIQVQASTSETGVAEGCWKGPDHRAGSKKLDKRGCFETGSDGGNKWTNHYLLPE